MLFQFALLVAIVGAYIIIIMLTQFSLSISVVKNTKFSLWGELQNVNLSLSRNFGIILSMFIFPPLKTE